MYKINCKSVSCKMSEQNGQFYEVLPARYSEVEWSFHQEGTKYLVIWH